MFEKVISPVLKVLKERRRAPLVGEVRNGIYWSSELLKMKKEAEDKVARLRKMGLLQPGVRFPKGGLAAILRLM